MCFVPSFYCFLVCKGVMDSFQQQFLQDLMNESRGVLFKNVNDARKREAEAREILKPLQPRKRMYGHYKTRRARGKEAKTERYIGYCCHLFLFALHKSTCPLWYASSPHLIDFSCHSTVVSKLVRHFASTCQWRSNCDCVWKRKSMQGNKRRLTDH